jgi:hypothetical protein
MNEIGGSMMVWLMGICLFYCFQSILKDPRKYAQLQNGAFVAYHKQ